MKTVVLEVRSLKEALDDATRAMKTGRVDREARISLRFTRIALASTYGEAMGTAKGDVWCGSDINP